MQILKPASIFSTILVSCGIHASAQQVPLDVAVQNRMNEITIAADTSIFTGFRSVNWLEVKPYLQKYKTEIADNTFGISSGNSYAFKNLGTDNWIKASANNNVFVIDPVIDLNGGYEHNGAGKMFQAAGGIQLQGIVADKLSYSVGFESGYREYPSYLTSYIRSNQNYQPGLGKSTASGQGFNSTQINANISYVTGKHFTISTGYGRNFIGDGYRSLLLSDNPSNNPYVRVQARLWKLTYNVLYNQYNNPRFDVNGKIEQKYNVMHYLGINFSKKFQLGLFDAVTWYKKDSAAQRGFDVQYLNPLIFLRPLEFTVGSPDNAFIGLTGKYQFYKNGFVYGSLGLDDISLGLSLDSNSQYFGNKYALQLGIWNKDFLHIKNLSWRFEWNGVRPYEYGHGFGKIGLNYTHNNQSLADPFNANFHEFISIFQYHKDRWFGMLENLFTIRGENPGLPYNNGEDLWGGEEGVPNFGSKTMQGNRNKYFYNQLTAGYLLNPRNRLALQADVVYRRHTAPGFTDNTFFASFGITTRIFNNYHDF